MKKFLKKNISVFLIFFILLSTVLPVLNGVFAKAESAEIILAVENLKQKWKELEIYENDGTLLVNRWYGAAGSYDSSVTAKASSTYTETVPNGVMLGNRYMQMTLAGAGEMTGNKQIILFETGSTTVNASSIKDVVFWAKPIFAGATDVTFKFRVHGGGLYQPIELFTVSADSSGDWVRVSLKETVGEDTYTSVFSKKDAQLTRLDVCVSGNNGDVITVGSPILAMAATLPENTDDWYGEQWLDAAKSVTHIANDDTQFRAAIINLEAAIKNQKPKELALKNLKNAWKNLGAQVDGLGVGRYFDSENVNMGYIEKPSDIYAEDLPEGVDLGRYFVEIILNGKGEIDADSLNPIYKQVVLFEKDGAANKVGDIEDVRFWVKPTFAGTKDITVKASVNFNARNIFAGEFIIPVSKNGQWVEVSIDEIAGGDWKSNLQSALERKPGRFDICFSGNNGDSLIVGSALEVISETRELPENSSKWDCAKWVTEAYALDISDAVNVFQFKSAIRDIESVLGDELLADIAVLKLKDAWSELYKANNSGYVTDRYWVDNESSTHVSKNVSNYTEILPQGVNLGNKYAELTLYGDGSIIDPRHQQLFLEGNSANTIGAIDDIVFWVKPTFVADSNISFSVAVTFSQQNIYETHVNIPVSKDGQWIKVSLNELAGGNWKEKFKDKYSDKFTRIELTFSGGEDDKILVGSAIEVTEKIPLPVDSDEFTLTEWIDAASAVDAYGYQGELAFRKALRDAIILKDKLSENLAIAELKQSWTNLGYAINSPFVTGRYWLDDKSVGHIGTNSSNYPQILPDEVNLGNEYAQLTLSGKGNIFGPRHQQLFLEGVGITPVKDIEDIVFWVRPTFAGVSDISFSVTITFNQQNTYETLMNIPLSKDGQWTEISLNELAGGNWKEEFKDKYSDKITRIELTFSGNEGDKILVGSAREIISHTRSLPVDSEDWTVDQWVEAAGELNLTNAINVSQFKNALSELYKYASVLEEEVVAINNLRASLEKMSIVCNSSMVVKNYYSNGSATDIGVYSQEYPYSIPDDVMLGDKYGKITLSGNGSFETNK